MIVTGRTVVVMLVLFVSVCVGGVAFCVLVIAALFILVNLVADLLNSWLDPRIEDAA